MKFAAKRVICAVLAILMLLSLVGCAQDVPEQTAPVTEIVTEPATVQMTEAPTEPPVDPFEVDDGLVDSTNDIVIDFYEFLEERNKAHQMQMDVTFSKEFIESVSPDFYDTMDLVSKEEAQKLLNTPNRFLYDITTREAALKDVDLLFRIFKSYYGPYFYFGGDEVFSAAEERIIQQVKDGPDLLSLREFAGIISENLDFILDRHMWIGEWYVCDYNNIAVYDFYVEDLYFYQDDVGYYTKINDRKWYLDQVGTDTNILDYLQVTVDEKGQLCYCILLCESKTGSHLGIHEITLSRGDRTAVLSIEWTMFSQRKYRLIGETVTINNNIPLLEVGFWVPGVGRNAGKSEPQQARVGAMGRDFFAQDVFIYDFVGSDGTTEFLSVVPHSYVDIRMYKLSRLANDLGRWNMPWYGQSIGTYSICISNSVGMGKYANYTAPFIFGKNDTIMFGVQDKNNFSAHEGHIVEMHTMENVMTIGGSTGGTAGPSGATCQKMVLFNTGLIVDFGATVSIAGGATEDGFCMEPDIWYEPEEAAEAAYRICEFYGIENTADTSRLSNYNYLDTEYEEELKQFLYYRENPMGTDEADQQNSVEQLLALSLNVGPDGLLSSFIYTPEGSDKSERYVFGIAFDDPYAERPSENQVVQYSGINMNKTIYPCIWRFDGYGIREVAEELMPLLTNVEFNITKLGGSCAEPKVKDISDVWPGGKRVLFKPFLTGDSAWQCEFTAQLNGQLLTATQLFKIIGAPPITPAENVPPLFDYDVDNDGIEEYYTFGITLAGSQENGPLNADEHTVTLGSKDNFIKRTVHPCVWRVEDDGTLSVAGEFSSLLRDVTLTINRINQNAKEPTMKSVSHVWPGCTEVTFGPFIREGGGWQYEFTAKLENMTLNATAYITIQPG